jgi:Arc/MetJ family transcription regulator
VSVTQIDLDDEAPAEDMRLMGATTKKETVRRLFGTTWRGSRGLSRGEAGRARFAGRFRAGRSGA